MPGALTEPVDRALDLRRPRCDTSERVRDRQAEVVVAMDRQGDIGELGAEPANLEEERRVLLGQRVADGVGKVDRRRSGLDGDAGHLCHESRVGAGCVLAAELDLVDASHDVRDRSPSLLDDLGRLEPELVLHVDRTRCEDDVNSGSSTGTRECLDRRVEILGSRSCERRDRGPGHRCADGADALEVTRRGERKARLDHVDAEALERHSDLHLLVGRERNARGLLAIPERRVEDRDPTAVCHVSAPPVGWP